jgi:hypothetical protein
VDKESPLLFDLVDFDRDRWTTKDVCVAAISKQTEKIILMDSHRAFNDVNHFYGPVKLKIKGCSQHYRP